MQQFLISLFLNLFLHFKYWVKYDKIWEKENCSGLNADSDFLQKDLERKAKEYEALLGGDWRDTEQF